MEVHEATETYLVVYEVDVAGNPRFHQVPWEALASWGELLGIDDPHLTLQVILDQDRSEPDWTSLYAALAAVVQAQARATLAANAPVMIPFAHPLLHLEEGELRALETGRAVVQAAQRAALGIPETAPLMRAFTSDPDPIATAVADHITEIEAARSRFIAQYSPLSEGPPHE